MIVVLASTACEIIDHALPSSPRTGAPRSPRCSLGCACSSSAGGTANDLRFALTEGTAALLAAVDRAPLRPLTVPEEALRRLATVLNRPVTLAPGSGAHTEITAAVAGARSAVGGTEMHG